MNYISSTSNNTLMARALESLKGKWGIAIGSWLVYFILTNLSLNISLWEWQGNDGGNYKTSLDIIGWIINGPLNLGYIAIILLISRGNNLRPILSASFSI